MEIFVAALLVFIAVLIVVILRRQSIPKSEPELQPLLLMQQQLESLRSDVRQSIQDITASVNQQLASVTQQIQSQTNNVGNRLESATRVIGDVQRNLGELGKATQEIKELGLSVSKLDQLLRAPKLRGGLGEFLLEDLLKQVLPSDHFEMQYQFKNGQTVDAVIHTAEGIVPVDSKFPFENFKKMVEVAGDTEKKSFQKAFLGDVKKHIDAIKSKYILPDEGTFPFALMYVPAENIYYEIMIKDDASGTNGLYSYAINQKVIPVSPNSFYAYLQVIAFGLRGMRIEQGARKILDELTGLQENILKVREAFDTLGSHLENAGKRYAEAEKRLSTFEGKLESAGEKSLPAATSDRTLLE